MFRRQFCNSRTLRPNSLNVRRSDEKRPYKLSLTWLLDEVEVRGELSPYHRSLEIHAYRAAFVRSLPHLDRLINGIRAHA